MRILNYILTRDGQVLKLRSIFWGKYILDCWFGIIFDFSGENLFWFSAIWHIESDDDEISTIAWDAGMASDNGLCDCKRCSWWFSKLPGFDNAITASEVDDGAVIARHVDDDAVNAEYSLAEFLMGTHFGNHTRS